MKIVLSNKLAEELKKNVPRREWSKFIAEAIQEKWPELKKVIASVAKQSRL